MHKYFNSYHDYFWRWEDQGEVIAIPNGSTISYVQFIQDTLRKMAPQGLPPFGALLLAIIATNPNAQEDIKLISKILESSIKISEFKNLNEYKTGAFKMMQTLASLPQKYKKDILRIELLNCIFEKCHPNFGIKASKEIVESLSHLNTNNLKTQELNHSIIQTDFRCLDILNKKFPDEKSILNRLAYVVNTRETTIEELQLVQEPNTSEDIWLDLLNQNPNTFHIGRLIKHLWAGLHIPIHQSDPSTLPTGGVSDISNKGDINRLLISEYANEDLIFQTRILNNEALYFQREQPPSTHDKTRIFLLDITLRNWGIPKLVGLAVILAFIHKRQPKIKHQLWMIGSNATASAIETVDDIIKAKLLLSSSLTPVDGLEHFFSNYAQKRDDEIIWLSSFDTFKILEVQKILKKYHDQIYLSIGISVEGQINLWKKHGKGTKHLQALNLDLPTIWKPTSPKTTSPQTFSSPSPSKYPIRFVPDPNAKYLLDDENKNLYYVTKNKDLYFLGAYHETIHVGATLILEKLPSNCNNFAIGKGTNGKDIIICINSSSKMISIIELSSGNILQKQFISWNGDQYQFFYLNGKFNYLTKKNNTIKHWTITKLADYLEIKLEEEISEDLLAYHTDMISNISIAKSKIKFGSSTLRLVSDINIDHLNQLCINNHSMILDNYQNLILQTDTTKQFKISARKIDKNTFQFPNGHIVSSSNLGLIMLQKKDIPNQYEIVLEKMGNEKSSLIKSIKEIFGSSLIEIKGMLSNGNVIKKYTSEEECIEAYLRLKNEIAPDHHIVKRKSIDINQYIFIPTQIDNPLGIFHNGYFAGNPYFKIGYPDEKTISMNDFYHEYIKTFINDIVQYGT